jgi:predicted glycosyltransferase involved in capsule biosynthesis
VLILASVNSLFIRKSTVDQVRGDDGFTVVVVVAVEWKGRRISEIYRKME